MLRPRHVDMVSSSLLRACSAIRRHVHLHRRGRRSREGRAALLHRILLTLADLFLVHVTNMLILLFMLAYMCLLSAIHAFFTALIHSCLTYNLLLAAIPISRKQKQLQCIEVHTVWQKACMSFIF